MDTFEGIQHIGEHIFNYLPIQDILNCRLTGKSWKKILDNPTFWLNKLNSFGQHHPREIHNKWLTLIKFANQNEVPLSKITYCLIIKYCKFIIHSREKWIAKFKIKPSEFEWIEIQKFMLGLPPIYQALHTKSPDIEVIKLIGDSDETFTNTVECPRKYKLYYAGFILPHRSELNYFTSPLHESIKIGHDLDVLKYLLSKTKIQDLTEGTPIDLAVKRDNLQAYKFLIDMIPEFKPDQNQIIAFAIRHKSVEILKYLVSQTEYPRLTYRKLLLEHQPIPLAIQSNNLKLCQLFCEMALTEVDNMVCFLHIFPYIKSTPIHMAILTGKVEILKYLVSKSNEPNKIYERFSGTPLHDLAQFPCEKYSNCPCVEMLKIIVPKIVNFDVQYEGNRNQTPLQLALSQYHYRKTRETNDCLEQKIKILAPLSNLKFPDKGGMTALDYAQKDPDIHRIFSELNLL